MGQEATQEKFNLRRGLLVGPVVAILSGLQFGCVVNSAPDVQEITSTSQPMIQGQTSLSLTSPSSTFVINGVCDTKSYGTEYSLDLGATWIDLGPCSTGTFTFNVLILNGNETELRLRARTKFAFTPSSIVNLRIVLASTANLLSFVSASRSDFSNLTSPTLSFTMPSFMTGARPSAASTFNIDHHPTGIAYAR